MSPEGQAGIWDVRGDRLDRAIEWLFAIGLVFMPLAFGAVEAWSEAIILALVAAASVLFLVKIMLTQRASVVWTWAYVPIAAYLIIAAVQLIPMPAAWVGLISPNTVALRTELLGDLPNAETALSRMTISFYAHATRHDLRLMLAGAAVFVIVLNVYRRPDQIKRLLAVISAVGAGIALLALAQNIGGNDRIYWLVPAPQGMARSGPFVNHSHYGQFMNLSVGAALALIFVILHEAFGSSRTAFARIAEYLGSPRARVVWALAGMVVLGASTVFLSMTRGGMVSMLSAGAFTALVVGSRRSLTGAGWVMALLGLAAFICVLYIGFDAVYERLTTLGDLQVAQGGRWQILKDVAVAWSGFPVLGLGLGTHEFVYPMFDRSTVASLATHAENEYAQAAEETGILGLVILVIFGLIIGGSYFRVIRSAEAPICSAAYGLGFGLMAILLHSLTDFGQHVPANALLTLIFCALLVRLAHYGRGENPGADSVAAPAKYARPVSVAVLALVCLVAGWVVVNANAARVGEARWKKTLSAERNLAEKDWQGSDEQYAYLIRHATAAADSQQDNVRYRHWLNVYRWRAISRAVDPNTGGFIISPQTLALTDQITEEFSAAAALCPTFGPAWSILGQLEKFVLGRDEQGARHIRRGRRLAPCDATTCLVTGDLEAEEGNADAAFENWQRAVELDGSLFREVALRCIEILGQPERVMILCGDNINRLLWFARPLEDLGINSELADEVNRKLRELLERKCREPQAPAEALISLARIYRQEGKIDEAIALMRRALALDPGRPDWHYRLATLLVEKGLIDEAIQELRKCLRLEPQHKPALKLLEKLSTRTEPPTEESESP